MAERSEKALRTYDIDYRDVKHARLEYKTGHLMLILPREYEDQRNLLEKYRRWIATKEGIIRQALEESKDRKLELERPNPELKTLVQQTVERYREQYGFKINSIFFRKMKTKWGSNSPKGNLTINTLLRYLPEELIHYVIFHELAHSRERRHNERFWRTVSREFGDWKRLEGDLLVYWFMVQDLPTHTSERE